MSGLLGRDSCGSPHPVLYSVAQYIPGWRLAPAGNFEKKKFSGSQ